MDCCIKINSLTSFSVTVGETLCLLFSLALVLLSTHIYILFFCRHFKNPVRKHSEFSDLCDPARLLTNQIAYFTVVIIYSLILHAQLY